MNYFEVIGNDSSINRSGNWGIIIPEPQPPTFDDIAMTKCIVFGTMFVIAFIGNVATLIQMYRMRHRKSTINTLIVNLAIGDLFIVCFCFPVEGIWAATVQWYGGTAMCKIIKFIQVFSLYLSTYVTVAIGLDRCVAILDPMRRKSAPTRVRTMIMLAWFFSALFSIPQAIIFNVRRGPFKEDFYQCVTMGSYPNAWQEEVYSIASFLLMFVIPLVIIGTAYGLIFSTIARKSKEFIKKNPTVRTTSYNDIQRGPVRSNLLRKAKRKSLRMSIVIVVVFVMCWTPYYVIFICLTFLDWEEINPRIYRLVLWLFFLGMSNAVMNPLIYGAFQICKVHTPRSVHLRAFRSHKILLLFYSKFYDGFMFG
ncbi:hypothetical protein LOTGIDRAFT_103088 [Lottia gigantea]|uniref:G-protein coupled receptors family 1 profile domain-containing protein n=1 Tax=Lottia gigantea TaxID=225164 RepID=V4BCY4_LOTGI|nr:hypothetical protein LOTGIDRAFT_103088 [Lottia gigantea]ESP05621.1 hypothetical protein LOTGIDRAFT_103088 [Lottia gigantea]